MICFSFIEKEHITYQVNHVILPCIKTDIIGNTDVTNFLNYLYGSECSDSAVNIIATVPVYKLVESKQAVA